MTDSEHRAEIAADKAEAAANVKREAVEEKAALKAQDEAAQEWWHDAGHHETQARQQAQAERDAAAGYGPPAEDE